MGVEVKVKNVFVEERNKNSVLFLVILINQITFKVSIETSFKERGSTVCNQQNEICIYKNFLCWCSTSD